jgi:hypothetical protein
LFEQTSLGKMDKSMVVLDSKLEHTNGGRRELLAYRRRAPGVPFIGQAGRPAWVDRP